MHFIKLDHWLCSQCLKKLPRQGIGKPLIRDSTNNLEIIMLLRNVVFVTLGAKKFWNN